VEEPLLVHVRERLERLEHDVAHGGLAELLGAVLHHLLDVLVELLEDHVEFVVGSDDLLELHDVGVSDLAQGLDLAQVDALLPAEELLLHLLDCYCFIRTLVDCFLNCPLGPISDCFHYFLTFHQIYMNSIMHLLSRQINSFMLKLKQILWTLRVQFSQKN